MENLEGATQFAYIPAMSISAVDYVNMASVSATLPIYAGGQIKNGNKLAAIGEDVSHKQEAMTVTDVLVQTENLYWNIIALNEKLKTLNSYDALLDTLVRDVNNYVQAGLTQRNDLLKVQLKKNELQSNRLKLENGITLTKMALCQHIGIPYDPSIVFSVDPFIDAMSAKLVSPDQAIANRPEYQMLNKATEAETLQLKMTRGELMPTLALGAMAAYIDIENSGQSQKFAFASMNIPISNWWGGSHKIKQHQLKLNRQKPS